MTTTQIGLKKTGVSSVTGLPVIASAPTYASTAIIATRPFLISFVRIAFFSASVLPYRPIGSKLNSPGVTILPSVSPQPSRLFVSVSISNADAAPISAASPMRPFGLSKRPPLSTEGARPARRAQHREARVLDLGLRVELQVLRVVREAERVEAHVARERAVEERRARHEGHRDRVAGRGRRRLALLRLGRDRARGRACESDRLGHERGRRGDEAEGDDDLHVLVVCVRDGSL